MARSIPGCASHREGGKTISRNIEVHPHVFPVSGCDGDDHREHGVLCNLRDGIQGRIRGNSVRDTHDSSSNRKLWHRQIGGSVRTKADTVVGAHELGRASGSNDRGTDQRCFLDRRRMHWTHLRRCIDRRASAAAQSCSRRRSRALFQLDGAFVESRICRWSLRVGIRRRWTETFDGNGVRISRRSRNSRDGNDSRPCDAPRRSQQFRWSGTLEMIYSVLRWITGIALHWFYGDIRIVGAKRIPMRAPLLIAVNHQNALVDSLIVGWLVPRRIAMTGKATLADNPLIAILFKMLHVVPLRRVSDEVRKQNGLPVDRSRNTKAFEEIFKLLERGGVLLIFPEGKTHNEAGLEPLKTGLARLHLQARVES